MAEGKRPGGLTALAVINFIFAGFNALGVLGALALMVILRTVDTMQGPEGDEAKKSIADAGGMEWIYASAAVSALLAALLLVSGIGYLKQKRMMGRTLGSVYAVIAMLFSLAYIVAVGMQFGMLIGFVYPVLTLILLNTTFKDDLVN